MRPTKSLNLNIRRGNLPFHAVLQPYFIEVTLAEAVPAAAFLGADIKIDQLDPGTYRDPGHGGSTFFAGSVGYDQGMIAMRTDQITHHLIFRQENC